MNVYTLEFDHPECNGTFKIEATSEHVARFVAEDRLSALGINGATVTLVNVTVRSAQGFEERYRTNRGHECPVGKREMAAAMRSTGGSE